MLKLKLGKIKLPHRKEKKEEQPLVAQEAIFKEPRNIVMVPHFKNISEVDIKYQLIMPFAYAHIKWDPKEKRLVYRIEEPQLTGEDEELIRKIQYNLAEIIDVKISVVRKKEKAIEYIQEKVAFVLSNMGLQLSVDRHSRIMYYIVRNFVGLNEIEPLMHDPYIEDIGCTGLETPIFIVHRRFGSISTNITFNDFDYLSNFVIKMAERCGRYISYAMPLLDGSLPDGSRVQASVAKDVTTKGPTFSIRKFRKNPYSPIDIVNLNTVSLDMMAYLWFLIQYNASILICGGVSTGKTTMLNILSMFIPYEDKVISIEDTREINIAHQNWVPSVSRAGYGLPELTGKRYGEIDLFDLLKESFRQNPDYVIVGEVRGKEAYVMFQGIASGHPSIGTMHAGSVDDVIKRLETPPIELSPSLIESLDVIIVMVNAREKGKDARRIKEISEIQNVDAHTGTAHTKRIFIWTPASDTYKQSIEDSELLRRISFQEGISYSMVMGEIEDRKKVLEWLQKNKVTDYTDFTEIINLYYKDKKAVLDMISKGQPPTPKIQS